MRKRIIAGNWKMNKTVPEAVELVKELKTMTGTVQDVDVVVCPPFVDLAPVHDIIKGGPIGLGAQNMHWEENGAFTGEISADMLKSSGCEYVILGHSERRQYFAETDDTVNKKLKAALAADLIPIVCVGEKLEEREADKTEQVVQTQVKGAFFGISQGDAGKVVLAYEPVWAIGTGKTATPEQAQEVHALIRQLMSELYDQELADMIRIQYGGSMKPANAAELLSQPDVDGGLIGGASLKADSFMGIIKA